MMTPMRHTLALLAASTLLVVAAPSAVAKTPAKTKTVAVSVKGVTKAVGSPAPGKVEDRGTVSGTPFGKGTIDLIATFDGTHVTATYTVTTKKGKVFGTTDMTLTVVGNNLTLDGTAKITGGTKAYKGISGRGLKVLDTNTLDGQNGRIALTGKVRLPK